MIADAPYIREAELIGIPGGDTDTGEAIKQLTEAGKACETVVDFLLAAEDVLKNETLRDLIYGFEDLGCDVRAKISELRG